MRIFKEEQETKRVIFNVDAELAARLEHAKNVAKQLGKKLNVDAVIDEALSRYLEAAEKQFTRIRGGMRGLSEDPIVMGPSPEDAGEMASTTAVQVRASSNLARTSAKQQKK
ncbi:MAG: hypothetical protein ACK5JO_14975 [Halodesulfovibrio sp.]